MSSDEMTKIAAGASPTDWALRDTDVTCTSPSCSNDSSPSALVAIGSSRACASASPPHTIAARHAPTSNPEREFSRIQLPRTSGNAPASEWFPSLFVLRRWAEGAAPPERARPFGSAELGRRHRTVWRRQRKGGGLSARRQSIQRLSRDQNSQAKPTRTKRGV
jgi:hypothetical protein